MAAGFTRVLFVAPEKKRRTRVVALLRAESVVRGYKVKVTRQDVSPEDESVRRRAVAGVIAKSLGRK